MLSGATATVGVTLSAGVAAAVWLIAPAAATATAGADSPASPTATAPATSTTALVALGAVALGWLLLRPRRPPPLKREDGVVYLHGYGRWKVGDSRLPDISPYVSKLECHLRLAGIPYRCVHGVSLLGGGMSRKNKMPWVELNGEVVADSQVAVEHITREMGVDLDASLSPERRATLHAARKMLEEGTYWGVIKHRYTVVGLRHIQKAMASCVPAGASWPIALYTRFTIGTVQLWGQGYGRHTPDEVYAMDRADIDALEVLLGDAPYFGGAKPCSFDAVAHAFLTGMTELEWGGPDKEEVLRRPKLVAFVARVRKMCWPDWEAPATAWPSEFWAKRE